MKKLAEIDKSNEKPSNHLIEKIAKFLSENDSVQDYEECTE